MICSQASFRLQSIPSHRPDLEKGLIRGASRGLFLLNTLCEFRGRTLMTNKVKFPSLCAVVRVVIIVAAEVAMSFAADASLPQKQSPKRTVAYRRLHPKGVKAPVVIHDLTVNGKEQGFDEIGATKEEVARPVDPATEFEADDNSFVESI